MIRVMDLETTGFPPDAAIVEIGWCDITEPSFVVCEPESSLINPGIAIEPGAMASHHIIDADVKDAPEFPAFLSASDFYRDNFIYAAHKADFEKAFWNPPNTRWIDTWKVVLRLAPKAPGHSNQMLRYWLNLDVDRELASPPHRAGPDAYVTAHLLARMLTKMSVEEMIEISSQPALLPHLHFGKHAMIPCAEVPTDYWDWVLRQDFDADVKFTARHYLALGGKP